MPDSSRSSEERGAFSSFRAKARRARSDLARFRALSNEDKLRLAAFSIVVPLIDASLDVFRFQQVRDALERSSSTRGARASRPYARADAHRIAELAGVASRRGLVRADCLPRSLAVWWWLRRDGLPVDLRIGTLGGEAFSAHAWVELEGAPLGEPVPRHRAFEGL